MKVTVLIATRNRSASLGRTLESLFSVTNLAVEDWEAVVVDNGSTDGTLALCAAYRDQYPGRFRCYVEHRTGKSNALNRGIALARGEILALTDDDVICAPDYLAGIRATFEQCPVDVAQGRIFLDCEGGLPAWMSPSLLGFMSLCDHGNEIVSPFKPNLSGTNMVVRNEAARAVGGFAPELGAGTTVGFAEDSEFSARLRSLGYRFIYAPRIVVRHQLSHRQLTRSFFRKRCFGSGRSRAYYAPYVVPLWRFGLYVAKNWILSDARALWLRWKGLPAIALDCQCEARRQAGFFWQHCLFYLGIPRRLSLVTCWTPEARIDKEMRMDVDLNRICN